MEDSTRKAVRLSWPKWAYDPQDACNGQKPSDSGLVGLVVFFVLLGPMLAIMNLIHYAIFRVNKNDARANAHLPPYVAQAEMKQSKKVRMAVYVVSVIIQLILFVVWVRYWYRCRTWQGFFVYLVGILTIHVLVEVVASITEPRHYDTKTQEAG